MVGRLHSARSELTGALRPDGTSPSVDEDEYFRAGSGAPARYPPWPICSSPAVHFIAAPHFVLRSPSGLDITVLVRLYECDHCTGRTIQVSCPAFPGVRGLGVLDSNRFRYTAASPCRETLIVVAQVVPVIVAYGRGSVARTRPCHPSPPSVPVDFHPPRLSSSSIQQTLALSLSLHPSLR